MGSEAMGAELGPLVGSPLASTLQLASGHILAISAECPAVSTIGNGRCTGEAAARGSSCLS